MRKELAAAMATVIAVLLAVPATYAVLRAYDVLFHPLSDPATAAWSVHIAMFWRLLVGGYVAGMLAPVAYVAARQNLVRTLDALCTFTLVVAAMIAVQGLVPP